MKDKIYVSIKKKPGKQLGKQSTKIKNQLLKIFQENDLGMVLIVDKDVRF